MNFREKLSRVITNQSELSRRTGLSQSSICEILSGKRRGYFDQVALIARTLGLSLDWLADETRDELPKPEWSAEERLLVAFFRNLEIDIKTATQRLAGGPR